MSSQIAGEGWFMLHSFLLGAFITFCYDLFRILRRIIPHGIFWISLEDLVFWVMVTGGIFISSIMKITACSAGSR